METKTNEQNKCDYTFLLSTKEDIIQEVNNQCKNIVDEVKVLGRKCDRDLYKSLLFNFEVRKVYLDPTLNLVKLSHIVGTNTTYLSNVINIYFKCNLKRLINRYRVKHARYLLDVEHESIGHLPYKCGFTSRSVFYTAFKKITGITPLQYVALGKRVKDEF